MKIISDYWLDIIMVFGVRL